MAKKTINIKCAKCYKCPADGKAPTTEKDCQLIEHYFEECEHYEPDNHMNGERLVLNSWCRYAE